MINNIFVIILITTRFQTIKAATRNPVNALSMNNIFDE